MMLVNKKFKEKKNALKSFYCLLSFKRDFSMCMNMNRRVSITENLNFEMTKNANDANW